MEDPYMEWEMHGSSSEENNYGKVGWILNKGLSMGKKILVAGFVVSSAPLVLPPLAVVSAIGLACSLPYGIFLASYVCTEKLMSKLLPSPTMPSAHFVEYGVKGVDDYDMEEVKGWDGMRLEPAAKGDEEVSNTLNVNEYAHEGFNKDERESVADRDAVEENGYQEEVREEKPSKVNGMIIEGLGVNDGQNLERGGGRDEVSGVVIAIEGNERSGGNFKVEEAPFEVTSVAVELLQGHDIEEDKELVRETRGFVESIRDEDIADNGVQEEKQSVDDVYGGTEKVGQGFDSDARQVRQSGDRNGNAGMEADMRMSRQNIEENGDRAIPIEGVQVEETGSAAPKEMQPIPEVGGLSDKKDIDTEAQKSGSGENKVATTSDEDAREIADESGLDLYDDKKAASYSADYQVPEGSEQSSYPVFEVAVTMELAVPSTMDGSKSTGITSEEDIDVAASEVLDGEQKIWKQIRAMRTIVGYTAPVRVTCMEEIKALYLFTGIEPPASCKDPFDLVEANDKLRYLMSIVGVK